MLGINYQRQEKTNVEYNKQTCMEGDNPEQSSTASWSFHKNQFSINKSTRMGYITLYNPSLSIINVTLKLQE